MSDDKKRCWKTGKVCYTEREASGTIRYFKYHKAKVHKNKNIPVRYYKCQYCNCYHLTHYKNRYSNRHTENKRRERNWIEGVK